MAVEYQNKEYIDREELNQLLSMIEKSKKYAMSYKSDDNGYIEKIMLEKYVSVYLNSLLKNLSGYEGTINGVRIRQMLGNIKSYENLDKVVVNLHFVSFNQEEETLKIQERKDLDSLNDRINYIGSEKYKVEVWSDDNICDIKIT